MPQRTEAKRVREPQSLLEPQSLPDVDPDEEVGAAPVSPQDGQSPYPPDVPVYQDFPDEGGEG
jgi:hypothetical protein